MDYEERFHEQDLKRVQRLRIFDDDFLKEVFDKNIEATELILNIIFARTDIKVMRVIGQREIKGLEGHSVKLDIMAQDGENRVYDIEVQRQDKGELPLRARYNSSMMDTLLLPSGEDYSRLVPTYVIFFTEKDSVGDNLPMHHYMMRDTLTQDFLGDERHIIFVNGDNNDENTPLGKLVHDFKCTSADEMYFDVLAKRVRHFKETEGGITRMCKLLEDMRKETAVMTAIETARLYGIAENTILDDIKNRFDLTETEARAYMAQKSA